MKPGNDSILSSSPSTSSLTSDEEPFDHKLDPATDSAPPLLGLRELAALRKSRKKPTEQQDSGPKEIKLLRAVHPASINHAEDLENHGNPRPEEAAGIGQTSPVPSSLPFAMDVEIKGWKIVGGKSWTGGAKVGAYVGEFECV